MRFEPLLGWEQAYVSHDYRIEKGEIHDKQSEYNQENGIQVNVLLEIKLQKCVFVAKYEHFSAANVSFVEPVLVWESIYVCHNQRTAKKPFAVNNQDTNQATDIQVTFMLEIKLQKYIFQQIVTTFYSQ